MYADKRYFQVNSFKFKWLQWVGFCLSLGRKVLVLNNRFGKFNTEFMRTFVLVFLNHGSRISLFPITIFMVIGAPKIPLKRYSDA